MPLRTAEAQDLAKPEPVFVTYIANEGVLLSAGDDKVLIDAIHRFYKPAYLATPDPVLRRLFDGDKPFNSIDLLLVSHIHPDHFDAAAVANYLETRPEVALLATPQVADSVLWRLPESSVARNRIARAEYGPGVKWRQQVGKIEVQISRIAHGGARWSWIQNAGHLIIVGGKRFLHIGDPAFGEQDFDALQFQHDKIDVAILPAWFLTSDKGRFIIENRIKPRHLIAVHVSPADAQETIAKVARFYPAAVVFTEPLQRVQVADDELIPSGD